MSPRTNTRKIIVHCSDTDGGTVEAIREYHIKVKGWEDIGYHWVILQDGTVCPGRREDLIGAHCEGENHDSVGICLIGIKDFSPDQINGLKLLAQSLINKYGLIADNVTGHYEWPSAKAQGKTCPNIPANDLRSLVKGNS